MRFGRELPEDGRARRSTFAGERRAPSTPTHIDDDERAEIVALADRPWGSLVDRFQALLDAILADALADPAADVADADALADPAADADASPTPTQTPASADRALSADRPTERPGSRNLDDARRAVADEIARTRRSTKDEGAPSLDSPVNLIAITSTWT